ncbi:hypothetical protein [Streptomyces sp. 2323.1]|uniref:hypothetical protein n=1 Tax=Streptomyces sp. 2323.1 TaxID=1938841 RepID=UPI000BB8808B|nr:hypothetical protein [Streptomyces sp. 2323.1]
MRDDVTVLNSVLSTSFGHDLLTEWIPDALGATDVIRDLAGGTVAVPERLDVGWLQVPLTRRTERVPVVPPAVRAHAHLLVERSLLRQEPRPEVFSYGSPVWDYRSAYRARQTRMREMARRGDLPLVLRLDIHRFGQSLPLHVLLDAPWMTGELAGYLTELHRATGRCLLPGHRWANRLGTAALAPIDVLLAVTTPGRWLRWGDDWHVFVRDSAEAEQVRGVVEGGLEALGLWLSEDKSTTEPVNDLFAGPAHDVAGHPPEVWRRGIQDADVRALRYALARIEPDEEVSRALASTVRTWPVLLPRAVQYLDRAVGTSAGQEAARELLETAHTNLFVAARILALAGRHQALASGVSDRLLGLAAGCEISGLRALAARVALCTGRRRLVPEPPLHLLRWTAQGADIRRNPPSVATLL